MNQEVAKGLAAGRRAGIAISDEQAWTWLAIAPGFAIFVVVLAFNLVGDGLRDALDPRADRR